MNVPTASTKRAEQDALARWQALRRGDVAGLSGIYEAFYRDLYSYGFNLCRDKDATEDAIQDLFVDLWRLRETLTEQVQSVRFYLYRSLRRKLHRASDLNARFRDLDQFSEQESGLFDASYETQLIQTEQATLQNASLGRALERLPKRQHEALTLRFFHQFEVREIAELMGISEQTARNQINLALQKIRQSLVLISGLIALLLAAWLA